MWRGLILVAFILAGCAGEVAEPIEERGVWIEAVESRNDSEFGYLLEVCSDNPLFQGAFVPFSVKVGDRSQLVERADHERISDECIEVRYDLERGFQEQLLSLRTLSFELDLENATRFGYAPEYVCLDSDGDNPFLSGFVSARAGSESFFLLDSCANETATEYVCEGDGRVGIILYECRDGCTGGSCRCLNSGTCLVDGSAVRI